MPIDDNDNDNNDNNNNNNNNNFINMSGKMAGSHWVRTPNGGLLKQQIIVFQMLESVHQ